MTILRGEIFFFGDLSVGQKRLNNTIAEYLAYAVAARAGDYQYDIIYIGEGAFALNIVFMVAQKVAATAVVQSLLKRAMAVASDDTFAVRLWTTTEDRSLNTILTDYSNVDVPRLKHAFCKECALVTAMAGPADCRTSHKVNGSLFVFGREL